MFVIKSTQKIPDTRNAKEHYQSFIKNKNTKSVKQSNIFIRQAKTFENRNTVDIKLVIIDYLKTSNKLCKTIRQAKIISQVYSDKIALYIVREKNDLNYNALSLSLKVS